MALTLNPNNYKIGDTIKFSTVTRGGKETITRKIVALECFGIGVRYNGYNPYWLNNSKLDKIIERTKK